MNQFRDILICALVILAVSLGVSQPENWGWVTLGGSYAVNAITFLADGRPWSIIVLMALALALFMTRLKY